MRDEQAMHDAFGRMFPSPEDGFRVMRLWTSCSNVTDQWGRRMPQRDVFIQRASSAGYSQKIINAFLELS